MKGRRWFIMWVIGLMAFVVILSATEISKALVKLVGFEGDVWRWTITFLIVLAANIIFFTRGPGARIPRDKSNKRR